MKFKSTKEVCIHKTKIIAHHSYDITKAIAAQGFSHLSTGSELRPSSHLYPLLRHNSNFTCLKEIAGLGVNYIIEPLPEEMRAIELKAQLGKENAKSALTDETIPIATKLAIDDIMKGYGLIVTVDCLKQLKNREIYPYGIVH